MLHGRVHCACCMLGTLVSARSGCAPPLVLAAALGHAPRPRATHAVGVACTVHGARGMPHAAHAQGAARNAGGMHASTAGGPLTWASVLTTHSSAPAMSPTMRLTALEPPPPTPTTWGRRGEGGRGHAWGGGGGLGVTQRRGCCAGPLQRWSRRGAAGRSGERGAAAAACAQRSLAIGAAPTRTARRAATEPTCCCRGTPPSTHTPCPRGTTHEAGAARRTRLRRARAWTGASNGPEMNHAP